MKCTLYYHGAKYKAQDTRETEELINDIEIELSRVPNVGETIHLHWEECWIEARVRDVSTHYYQPCDFYKRTAWYDSYVILLDNVEIIEKYKVNEESNG